MESKFPDPIAEELTVEQFADHQRVIEESIEQELADEVVHGWLTQAEAEDKLFSWREKYAPLERHPNRHYRQ